MKGITRASTMFLSRRSQGAYQEQTPRARFAQLAPRIPPARLRRISSKSKIADSPDSDHATLAARRYATIDKRIRVALANAASKYPLHPPSCRGFDPLS